MVFSPGDLEPPRDVPSSEATGERTRVTLTLAKEDLDRLQAIAKSAGKSISEVLQRSVATVLFLQGQIEAGSTILLRSRDGTLREVKLPT
jgi:hypothetical protein